MLRTAAVLCWVLAAGFGLPGIPAIASVARGDGVWTFFGYPTYGHGPFERMGIPTTVPLLVAFLLVAVAEVGVGVLLWTRRPGRSGRRAGAAPRRDGVLGRLRPAIRADARAAPNGARDRLFALGRDGRLPTALARISPRTGPRRSRSSRS